ncbi:AAA family ATPase [Streptomyces albidoflavus]|uniref:AAA family ATPase n=1 Tax=Streptomyces albidoflavus TaxID=1886 RepID=UPI0007432A63|nr:AAA family ATPase [Streptomyces albidoflavus]KUL66026.1 adenylylsulfate kinase [Streptomyces albidoflavus]
MRATEPPRTGPVLVVIGGLPATGKSTVGRAVARRFGASYLGIDTIRQSLYAFAERDADADALRHAVTLGLGYSVAYALAEDLLSQGQCVFAECVNSRKVTRDAWAAVARRTAAQFHEVELICSDPAEHAHRATTRTVDIPGLPLPTWQDITERDYAPWDRPHLTLDTAGKSPDHTITELSNALALTP